MKTIAVFPAPTDSQLQRLLRCLAGAFPVRFVPVTSLQQFGHDALLLLADNDGSQLRDLAHVAAVYSAPAGPFHAKGAVDSIQLADTEELAAPLRGQKLVGVVEAPVSARELDGFKTLAAAAGRPLWQVSLAGAVRLHYRASLPAPGLADGQEVIDVLHESGFIALLPLVDFLRRLSEDDAWQRPPLRATFIIDDPNLHYPRYGHVDYQAFADHARVTGFHTCMAMVPFDGWYINPQAAAIFKNHPKYLSLSVHGNDHENKELASPVSDRDAEATIAHALRRVAEIERKSGVPIARIMVPPHGACSATFFGVMARAGFQGATTTRTSVWRHSNLQERAPGAGMALAEVVRGLPVIHRFRFKTDRWQHRIAISAYLNHPLLVYGHHEDFADGFDAFDEVVKQINLLGATWLTPAELFASNYESRKSDGVLWIRPFSRTVVIPPDRDCREVKLDLGNYRNDPAGFVQFAGSNSPEVRHPVADGVISVVLDQPRQITVRLESAAKIDQVQGGRRRTRLASMLRRGISEARDRLMR